MSSNQDNTPDPTDVSRRDFVSLSIAAGLGVAAGATASAQQNVMAMSEQVRTPDGVCDAALFHPTRAGRFPAVLLWSDAFGLRQATRDMGQRLAAEGYVVLVPNPFYRTAKAPVIDDPSTFNFGNPADRQKLTGLMGPLQADGAAERDAIAFIAYLDAQPMVDRNKKIGTQGYCMGGPLIMRTAAAVPNRVGAAASFHGGGLVTDQPNSPHLLAPKIKARMYVGVASNDDMQQPTAKDTLRQALTAAKVVHEVEVYQSLHGWCMSDMPLQNGAPIYNRTDAEKAWSKLLALYKASLT